MKRILFISPRLVQGGAEKQIVTIARLIKKHGYDVDFLCYSYGDFYEDILKQNGIRVYWIQHNYLLRLITCTWFIHFHQYDVVIAFLPTPSFIVGFASLFGKRWKVITGERSSLVYCPKTLRQKITAWLRRYSDYIVCNSKYSMNLWDELFPQYHAKLRTIYNTIVLDKIDSKYIPLKDSRLHICIAATVTDVKNPLGLIDALISMTVSEREKMVIDWYGNNQSEIGDTEIYDRVNKLIVKEGLQRVFRIHNAVKDIANKMNESDCVALFSKYEGLPNAICEGMMIGKPIIMTKVSDYDVLVEDGVNGFLCDRKDTISIKNVLLKMSCLSASQLKEMGVRSRQKASQLFSDNKTIKDWLYLIEC